MARNLYRKWFVKGAQKDLGMRLGHDAHRSLRKEGHETFCSLRERNLFGSLQTFVPDTGQGICEMKTTA